MEHAMSEWYKGAEEKGFANICDYLVGNIDTDLQCVV